MILNTVLLNNTIKVTNLTSHVISQGSYYCSFCAEGYIGTNKSGCYLDNFCVSGRHNCIAEANCIYLGPAQFRCVVSAAKSSNKIYFFKLFL